LCAPISLLPLSRPLLTRLVLSLLVVLVRACEPTGHTNKGRAHLGSCWPRAAPAASASAQPVVWRPSPSVSAAVRPDSSSTAPSSNFGAAHRRIRWTEQAAARLTWTAVRPSGATSDGQPGRAPGTRAEAQELLLGANQRHGPLTFWSAARFWV
jgi:hypothetical protein